MTSLPLAVDAETPLSQEELDVLSRQYEREGEQRASLQTKFNYAWGLVKSNYRRDQEKGIQLLLEILQEAPNRRRECYYYLALGFYKMGSYADAKRFNDALLTQEPRNEQALSLSELIDRKVSRDGMIGLGIVGSTILVGAVLVASLFRRR